MKKQQQQKNKQTNIKWMYSLLFFTMRQEGHSFDKALLGQKQFVKINNDRIRIQLGANHFARSNRVS